MWLDDDRRAIRQHFGDARRDLVGVVAHADQRVRAVLGGVLEHQLKRVGSRLLAQLACRA